MHHNMKKIIFGIAAFCLLIGGTVQAYTVQSGDTLWGLAEKYLGSGARWPEIAEENKLANPDIIRVGQELNIESLGVTLPTVIALFEDSLASKLSDTSTSTFTLVKGYDKQNRNLSGYYGFVIDEGSSVEEFITANCSSTTCSIVTRGIDTQDGETNVAALQHEHRRGAVVKLTNFPQLALLTRILNGQESTGTSTFKVGPSTTSTITHYFDIGSETNPFLRYNPTVLDLQFSPDGVNIYNFATTTAASLTASSTRGIGVFNSQIYIVASSTAGMTFDSLGNLYQSVSSTRGLAADSNGIYIKNEAATILFDSSGNIRANATSTARTPNVIPISNSTGRLDDWISTSTLNIQPYVAGEAINASSAPMAVYLAENDGRVYMTSSTVAHEGVWNFIGFVAGGQNVSALQSVNVQTDGVVDGFSGLTTTTGGYYFITNTDGVVSTTAGTVSYRVGRYVSPTSLKIDKGRKVYNGTTSYTSSSSTVITLGFRPSRVRIHAGSTGTHSEGGWSVNGGNNSVYATLSGASGTVTNAWNLIENTHTNVGTVNTITATGFTLTNVRTNAPNDANIFWEAEG